MPLSSSVGRIPVLSLVVKTFFTPEFFYAQFLFVFFFVEGCLRHQLSFFWCGFHYVVIKTGYGDVVIFIVAAGNHFSRAL